MIFSTSTYANTFFHIKEFKSSKGFVCWFVDNHETLLYPLALVLKNAGSKAGSKEGLSKLLSDLLDEGAGLMILMNLKRNSLRKNIKIKVRQNRDSFDVTFRTEKENIKDAFELIKFALTQPYFDKNILNV